MEQTAEQQVVWMEEGAELTLEGEPVLCYRLRWPRIEGGGRGAARLNRGYAAMARTWRNRWRREVYWQACLSLAACRGSARPFTPWRGEGGGEVTLWEDGLLALRMTGTEERGDGRICRVCWGDVWRVREGAPVSLKEAAALGRGWRTALCRRIISQGEARQPGLVPAGPAPAAGLGLLPVP